MRNTDICKHPGCERPQVAKGFCLPCYKRWRRNGTTHKVSAEDRFFTHVIEVSDCWLWTGEKWSSGYGLFVADKTRHQAHRWAYEFLRASIPTALVIDHLCETPLCVNPWHLEPVTQSENVRRSYHDECRNGHPYTPANTYHAPRGHRQCRTCSTERVRRFRKRRLIAA